MKTRYLILAFMVAFTSQPPPPVVASGQGVFLFGAGIDSYEHARTSWLDLDSLTALQLNAIGTLATDTVISPYYRIGVWDSLGINVGAGNTIYTPGLAAADR